MIKYIIAIKDNKIKHYKSDYLSHNDIASDKGIIYYNQIIERGIIEDNQCYIIECDNTRHFDKKDYQNKLYVRDFLNFKSREVESRYSYKLSGLKEGD